MAWSVTPKSETDNDGKLRPRSTSRSPPGKNGEVSRKHGNILIGTLRKTYGAHFAPGFDDHEKLSNVLHALDEPSLRRLIIDTPKAGSATEAV